MKVKDGFRMKGEAIIKKKIENLTDRQLDEVLFFIQELEQGR